MRKTLIGLGLLLLAVASPVAAQVVYELPTVYVTGAACPTDWQATGNTLPAGSDVFLLAVSGRRISLTAAALDVAYTTAGTVNTIQRDLAIAAGVTVRRRPGRAAEIECEWRPLGGQP